MAKNIFVVKCDLPLFESNFERKRNSDVINHMEIRQRLTNNDIYKNPPSDEIVEFHIMKKLNSFRRCKKTEFLFVYKESVDVNFMDGLRDLFVDCEYPVKFHLISQKSIIPKLIKNQFASVSIMNSDWNDKG